MFKKISTLVLAHKIISIVVVVVLVAGGYFWYHAATSGTTVTKYVVQKAATDTIIATVSGSGQMQALTTIDVKPQVSETVTGISVKVGDHVKAGQLLMTLDTTNEQRALTQAKLSLQSSEISLSKLTEAAATTTLLQDQNSVTQNESSLVTASTSLAKDYQTGFDTLSASFVDFQVVMTGLQSFVNGNDLSKSQNNPDAYLNLMPSYLTASTLPYRTSIQASYAAAAAAYQQNLADYHAVNRNSDTKTLDALFSETSATARTISEAVKSSKDFFDYVINNYPTNQGLAPLPTITNTFQTNMGNYTNTIKGDVSNLSGTINTISSDETAFANAQLSLNESSATLTSLLAGPDPLDVQSSQLSLEQQQLSVQTAQDNLNNCYVRSPIDGIVSSLPAVIGTTVASPAATVVGNGQVAQITLNEVDAAKVKVGDKATMTFDAITDLSLAGSVVEIDPVGTVSQGVVDYSAQVALATPSDQVKPGMSVTANIVTQVASDVITVSNSALVTASGASYVLEPATPVSDALIASSTSGGIALPAVVRVPVTIGVANDTETQITSGIAVGDQVITRTIASSGSAAASLNTTGNALRSLTGGGAGGFGGAGGVRITTGGSGAARTGN